MIEFDVDKMREEQIEAFRNQDEVERIERETLEKIKLTNRVSRLILFGSGLLILSVFVDSIINHTPIHPGWLILMSFNYFLDSWKVGR
jgi:hypothetical protein